MKVGFIGLGIMGRPMCKNLLKADYELFVYDRNQWKIDEVVKEGAKAEGSPKDVASNSDIIITMLPNSPHVEEVVLGEEGIIHGAKEGSIVIDMSSIEPIVSKKIGTKLAEKNIKMLDAPVSGGEPKAIDGTLSIMVGGDEETFNKCMPIFDVLGSSAVLCGEIGAGNITKLANQVIVAVNIAAMSEALVLATKSGVDPEKIYNAIRGGLAGSTVLDAKVPLILDRKFDPGFKIELHIKDLKNVLKTGHEIGTPLFLTTNVLEMMQVLKSDGLQDLDHGALIKFYEKLSNIEVKH